MVCRTGGLGRLFLHGLNERVGFSNGAVHVSDQPIDLRVDFHQLSFHGSQRARIEIVFKVERLGRGAVSEQDRYVAQPDSWRRACLCSGLWFE